MPGARTLETHSALRSLAVCALLSLLGCDGCGKDHKVPFKLDPSQAAPSPEQQQVPGPGAAPSGGEPSTAATYPDGTRSITLGGHSLSRPEGSFRAALSSDLDGDGALDALLVATDAQGRPVLGTALLRSAALVLQPTTLPLTSGKDSCVVESVRIAKLDAGLGLVELGAACTQAPAGAAPTAAGGAANAAPTTAAASPSTQSYVEHTVVSLETAPRVLLTMSTRSSADASALRLQVASADLDADEHTDVRLDITLDGDGQDPQRISLAFMNRPSGLARETVEPEQTLAQLATSAGQFLPKNPAGALAAAKHALALHRALCRESGDAELIIDGEPGVVCGPSPAAGRAALTLAIAQARGRDLFATLQAISELDSAAYKVDATQRERARKALALLPGDTTFVWRQGPQQRAPEGPPVRLPALAFIDDNQLLLRGAVARAMQLSTGEVQVVAASPSVLLTDKDGKLAAVSLHDECDGLRLHVIEAAQVLGALTVTSGASPSDVWVQRRAAVDDHCRGSRPQRHPNLQVIGYTAAGWLVADGVTLTLVPPAGQGDARVVVPTEVAPTVLAPGALTADGMRYVIATSDGVALVERGANPVVTLIRTPASCTATPSEAVISPSGARVAMLCGEQVYYAEHIGTEPPPSAATITPPTPEPAIAPAQPTPTPADNAAVPASASPTAAPTPIPIDQRPPPAPGQ